MTNRSQRIAVPFAILLAAALATDSRAGDRSPASPRSLHASGTAVVRVAPDRASLGISAVTRGNTAQQASETNARTTKAILDALRPLVRQPGEIATTGYDLAPEYDYGDGRTPGRAPRVVGYVATNRVEVTTDDLAGVGALIDSAVTAGAARIDSIAFSLSDTAAVRRRALEDAGRNARSEAESVARGLGLGLGEVLEASSDFRAPQPLAARGRMMAMEMAAAAPPPTEVEAGNLEVSATVNVTFAVTSGSR